MSRSIASAFVVAVVAALGQPAAAQTTFSDGDFDPGNWDYVERDTNEGGSSATEVVTDGNPGNALRITVTLNPSAGASSIFAVWLWKTPYDPATSGGFASIDYAEDARAFQTTGSGQATGVALRQADSVFIHRVDFTPDPEWVGKTKSGLVPADFTRLLGGGTLDFSATGGPIEVGFYRANSGPSAGPGGSQIVDIDNWSVTLVPPCAVDGDCDDGDGCTVDTCVAGVCSRAPLDCDDGDGCTGDVCTAGICSNPPLDCDDGNECTADACVAGFCQSVFSTTFDVVEARLTDLLARIEASPCGEEELVKKVIRKLRKQVKKARSRIGKADDASRDQKILKLVGKAQALLGKAQVFLGVAVDRGLISPACAATLAGLVAEVQTCIIGLPLPVF